MFRSLILREVSYVGKMTGVVPHPAPLPHLVNLYNKIIRELKNIPESSFFYSTTMAITHERLKIVNSTTDVSEIVKKTECQQIEELIIEAVEELKLIEIVKDTKPWEALAVKAPAGQWD